MSWKVRHQGETKFTGDQTVTQIAEGLRDGVWDSEDEVQGPGEKKWQTLSDHPVFEELVAAIDESEEEHEVEDQHIDMNPLIDVCLVLLVFFILATTMSVMEKVLNMPEGKKENKGPVTVSEADVRKQMIVVEAMKVDGRTVFLVEKKETPPANLRNELRDLVQKERKKKLVIDAQGVEWAAIIAIIDAATGAGIEYVNFKVPAPTGGAMPVRPS
ncbi:MAG TPA: biopolymer transporter ExbD [Gemmatales bacterium]|nr:biopolymer transporter ExbD [Gemmatales bacterium]HMP58792.1 biopolymer transporter ExbD [Gemmatales bacterium]